jgi:formylglycine-generating enzyme required for sulfatase activity
VAHRNANFAWRRRGLQDRMRRVAAVLRPLAALSASLAIACSSGAAPSSREATAAPVPAPRPALDDYTDSIPGTLVTFEMAVVPGGAIEVPSQGGRRRVSVEPFWIGRREVTWDEYDVWAFRLDLPRGQARGADAESRPSRPYGAPDHGFGHRGFPAIGVTHHAAAKYAEWLSAKTGRRYRLPTDAEWTAAARLAFRDVARTQLGTIAWHRENAGGTTHAAGSLPRDAFGLYDLAGNVAEWTIGEDGPVVRGGSYRDPPDSIGLEARARQTAAWNATDPQIPKSLWWLPDAPFVGFRLVREP